MILALQRRLAPLTAFAIIGLLLAWGAWREHSWFWGWDRLGIPAMPAPRLAFTDTISITGSIDCVRAGVDPYLSGQCDPWGRLFNYPPVWLEMQHLPITGESANVLGAAMAAITALATLAVFQTRSPHGFLIIVLTLLSPAFVFGIERGNVDTLLFSMLVFGLLGTRAQGRTIANLLRAALIVGLTILKIYPIAATAVYVGRKRRDLLWAFAVGLAASAAFFLSSWSRIALILSNTPLTSSFSYGAAPLFLDLAGSFAPEGIDLSRVRWIASAVALALGLTAATATAAYRCPAPWPSLLRRTFVDDLCLACLSIYCLTFLLGSNFNYRLIFLAGALPKLIESFDAGRRRIFLASPAMIVALLWASRMPGPVNYLLQWTVYTGACAWITHAGLDRVHGFIQPDQGEGSATVHDTSRGAVT